jgi:predicted MPP superfamily phosphohydrolase
MSVPRKAPSRRKRLVRRIVVLLLAVVLAIGVLVGRRLQVKRVPVTVGLPAPIRIAVLGDFHITAAGVGKGMAEKAVAEAVRQRPDAIILLGDYVSGRAGIPYIRTVFRAMRAPLGVYAVQGNHEHWADAKQIRRELEALGIRVLVNEAIVLRKGETRLALVGIDDLWAGKVDWRAAFKDVPRGVPVLLASHNPDAALNAEGQRAALIVSGHTHGGQVAPLRPILRAVNRLTGHGFPPGTRYGRSHLAGLFREPWGWVYVTSGVTTGPVIQRWFVRPEVAVLELS